MGRPGEAAESTETDQRAGGRNVRAADVAAERRGAQQRVPTADSWLQSYFTAFVHFGANSELFLHFVPLSPVRYLDEHMSVVVHAAL